MNVLFKNRVTEMLGVEIPVVQAPMGWIARSQLASAVSNAGGLGIIETSSGELDAIREEIKKMRTLTDKPFGVNIAQAFVRDPGIAQFIIDQGVKFVTTSAGSPERYTGQLKAAGLTVFHVVPSLAAALKAVDGAEGIQLGTRMVSAKESPVHENWKNAIVNAKETDTVFLNRFHSPALRALRTERTSRLEKNPEVNAMSEFGVAKELYFGGNMEAAIPLTGQVAGRIDSVRPVAEIIAEIREEFESTLRNLGRQYLG
ncbi:MAG: nitronate monooxygenase [Proteobacteria bacterium]|nr:nitronate monooxygenase [Pseudomonadota bacterium]